MVIDAVQAARRHDEREERRRNRMAAWLVRTWKRRGPAAFALYPLSLLYRAAMAVRRVAYRTGLKSSYRAPVPVIVVGNITVGGSGKTPFTIWLVRWLRDRGFRPGVVLRGYRGNSRAWPVDVTAATDPAVAGDEAVLLAARTGVPVVAGPDRAADCRALLARSDCDVVVSDDGLQHLALTRDFEIALDDPVAGRGNGWCLPAGPLREPVGRLDAVDLVVVYGNPVHGMVPVIGEARTLDGASVGPLESLAGLSILAVTGIARPERFFDALGAAGLVFDRLAFADHHLFRPGDIPPSRHDVILVTEKDAVKLVGIVDPRVRVVELKVDVAPAVIDRLEHLLGPKLTRHG